MKIQNLILVALIVCTQTLNAQVHPFSIARLTNPRGSASSVYSSNLFSLLKGLRENSHINIAQDPISIQSLEDPRLLQCPVLYLNVSDRPKLDFSKNEKEALVKYLDRGGFLFLDAGVSAAFLQAGGGYASNHNFPEWQVNARVAEFFKELYPKKIFVPVPRKHPLFSTLKGGLPDGTKIPEGVYKFHAEEKWREGAIATLGLQINDRIAVLATPILIMGWGTNSQGEWSGTIALRVREGNKELSASLQQAAHAGHPFDIVNEAGLNETVYTQPIQKPAWIHESSGRWRVFRYYQTPEMSRFAHEFLTQLGRNILTYIFAH